MNKEILDLLITNYELSGIENITTNTDGANEVYIVVLANQVKLVGKLYTHDIVPDGEFLNIIDATYRDNKLIPQFVKNKAGQIVTKSTSGLAFILSTFFNGKMIGDDTIDFTLCEEIVELLHPLYEVDSLNFALRPWYKSAILETGLDIVIKTDLSQCTESLVHGDLNHMNILMTNRELSGVIDWDGLHKDYLVTDLAIFSAHNLLKPETQELTKEFIRYCQAKIQLTAFDIALYYELINVRIQQIIKMLQKRVAASPNESDVINRYIAIWKEKATLII